MTRRWRRALVAVVALALVPAQAAADPAPREIYGFDGLVYPAAPLVVEGLDGDLYLGAEYDVACVWGGDVLEAGMRRLAALARVIEKSGRRALFTVAPGKADMVRQNLPDAMLPHGSCDVRAMADQRRVLQQFDDPRYVSARNAVAADPRPTYWKTDNHWNQVGVSDYVRALAGTLDRRLERRQRYRDVVLTHHGFINALRDDDTLETQANVAYAGPVTSTTTADSPAAIDSGGSDVRWRSTPARKTWKGQTLLLGDSYTSVGVGLLAPLFRHGRFLWNNDAYSDQYVAEVIADSDTVVIEVYQYFLVGHPLASTSLRKAVKQAVAEARWEPGPRPHHR